MVDRKNTGHRLLTGVAAAAAVVAMVLLTGGTAYAAKPSELPGPGKVCYQDPGRGLVCEPAKR